MGGEVSVLEYTCASGRSGYPSGRDLLQLEVVSGREGCIIIIVWA